MIRTKESNYICIEDDFECAVREAKKIYFKGGVFIYPTDTIYGFGANPFNEEALERINRIKGSPNDKGYIYLIDSLDTLSKYVEIKKEKHVDFLNNIWPNPISVVLNLSQHTANVLKLKTAAFRIANNRFCQRLTPELRMPLISTTVNRSNQLPINHPEIIKNEFGLDVDYIFYSNKTFYEKASTTIDLTESVPKLLREGKIQFAEIMNKYKMFDQ